MSPPPHVSRFTFGALVLILMGSYPPSESPPPGYGDVPFRSGSRRFSLRRGKLVCRDWTLLGLSLYLLLGCSSSGS